MPTSSALPEPSEFSLRDIVAEVAERSSAADPSLLVDPVLEAIAPEDYQEALRQALHGFICTFVVTARHTPRSSTEGATGRKIGTPRLTGVSAFLSSREFSPARGEWIHLSDATAEDLRSMAEKREAMALQYMQKSAWYASMAKELEERQVATVGKLPIMVQKRLLDVRPA